MSGPNFKARVAEHRSLLAKRGRPLSWEEMPAAGQAGDWFNDLCRHLPLTAINTARQLARLCDDDSEVTLPWRSLADAVGKFDRAGRPRAYVEGGVDVLKRHGWLEVETVGRGCAARTTFHLLPGDSPTEYDRLDWMDDWSQLDEAA